MAARGYNAGQPVYLSDRPQPVEIHLSREDSALFAGFPDLLTVQHLEVLLGQCGKTVRKLLADGTLPSVRIGERIYCPKARLIEFVVGECMGGDR